MELQGTLNAHAFKSKRIVLPDCVKPGVIIVCNNRIEDIFCGTENDIIDYLTNKYPSVAIQDYGPFVIMSGIIDSHVHVNEPGRTNWEGFDTATQTAAAAGVTVIADMPLNSKPPTTTVDNLNIKARVANGKVFVDVAFWGGVIPGNQKNLRPLVDAGVIGFKCFLCPSGVEEFPNVTPTDAQKALLELSSTNSVLAFHAEYEENAAQDSSKGDQKLYDTFLNTRPTNMEDNAIDMICSWCKKYNVRCHIVHLSSASGLSKIADAKKSGAQLTVETCYHYLVLDAKNIPNGATEYKCCPPIRDKANQDKLWDGIKNGTIDMVVSDHSPCVAELKTPGNFLTAWGGISSLQFGLSLLWTAAKMKGVGLIELSKLLSKHPAKLCRLDNCKGSLSVGMDADFVIWNPEETIKITEEDILFKNKITPYKGRTLFGKVIATVLREEYIYKDDQVCGAPTGKLLLNSDVY